MSVEKNRREAQRWFKTAQGDLESAVVLMKNIITCLISP